MPIDYSKFDNIDVSDDDDDDVQKKLPQKKVCLHVKLVRSHFRAEECARFGKPQKLAPSLSNDC